MTDRIKRFIECYVPVTACNLDCPYCYVSQQNRRDTRPVKFDYTPEQISKALSKERWGGVCFFSLCGAGETLIPHETLDIAKGLLDHGHYVNITTNGTLTKRFDELASFPQEYLDRLHFSFSFHYMELKKRSLLPAFFKNIHKVRALGCSILVQINLCDEYFQYLAEIKEVCIQNVGAPPQVALTRDQTGKEIRLATRHTMDEYLHAGGSFDSPLFEFGMRNFLVRRREFCYAGDWSFKLYLHTGELRSCYDSGARQNIFRELDKPIRFLAVGRNCRSPYCVNSTHFMAFGVIPEIVGPSYAELRDRPDANWYTPKMRNFLSRRLSEANREYGLLRKMSANGAAHLRRSGRRLVLKEDRCQRSSGSLPRDFA